MINIIEYLLTKSKKHTDVVNATNENIRHLVQEAIKKHGVDADLNFIDTSRVTNMYALFEHSDFCGDISRWDVSTVTRNVVHFESMFQGAEVFNQPIGKWKIEKAEYMRHMFYDADNFEQDLTNWQVDNVLNHTLMFSGSAMGAKRNLWPKPQAF